MRNFLILMFICFLTVHAKPNSGKAFSNKANESKEEIKETEKMIGPMPSSGPTEMEKIPDEQVAEMIGKMVGSDPFGILKLSEEEKKALIKGFVEGLENPLSIPELREYSIKVKPYYVKKLKEVKELAKMQEMAKKAKPAK